MTNGPGPKNSIVSCECGSSYEREVRELPIKDIGLFECHDCGARLEIWSGRSVPVFKRIAMLSSERRSA